LRQQAVIGVYTIERGSRRRLGALLLRVYRCKHLVYIGHTGTGFNQRTLADVRERPCASCEQRRSFAPERE
jgi:bifunctional non-homologous end joining protein LigD